MTTRAQLTPRRTLDRLLSGAAASGELATLYWFVEMKISPTLAGGKQPTIAACAYPLGWVPVVPVGADATESRHYADLLLECLKTGNRGRLIEFGLALTAVDVIADHRTYEWGEPRWDCVCVECGGVWQSTTANEEICEGCRGRRHPRI
ncbi:MAG: hypothetical protein KDE45_09380 [Caldilineaceae bacterium]|nr:hypothetical protein [Caldilineaceae bacterium]